MRNATELAPGRRRTAGVKPLSNEPDARHVHTLENGTLRLDPFDNGHRRNRNLRLETKEEKHGHERLFEVHGSRRNLRGLLVSWSGRFGTTVRTLCGATTSASITLFGRFTERGGQAWSTEQAERDGDGQQKAKDFSHTEGYFDREVAATKDCVRR